MFDDVLRGILETVDGATCVLLGGQDGMVVAAAVRAGASAPAPDLVAASMADLFRKAGVALGDAECGPPAELSVGGFTGHVVLREVAMGYVLAVCLEPSGSLGRARFELRKAAAALEPELV